MASFREIPNDRVRQLAETLKKNGLAASESEAVSMAQNMTQTESRVSQHFEDNRDTAVMNTGKKGSEGIAQQSRTHMTPTSEKEMIEAQNRPQPESSAQNTPTEPSAQNTEQPHAQEVEEAATLPVDNSREKEILAQESAQARAEPAPTHSNGAIAEAITNVQQSFEQPQQSIDLGVEDQGQSLAQTVTEPTQETAEQQQAPVSSEEFIAEAQAAESDVPNEQNEQPVQTPVQNSQTENSAQNTEETPDVQHEVFQAQPQEQAQQTAPAQTPAQNTQTESSAQNTEDPSQPETTQEVKEKAPEKDVSQMAESKVDLSNVFNFNK